MNQANQQVVNQNTNIALVNLRQQEIDYFITFFSSFGTQCFALTTILAGSVSQTPSFDCASGCNSLWQFIYNVAAAVSMAFTALCLLNSVFTAIYGQGLAIRGQAGSMVNAMEGMIYEQTRVVQMFVVGVIFFQIQAIGMFFIVMNWDVAVVCGVVMALASYYTYYCTLRIYNRFKWDFEKSGWNFDEQKDEDKVKRTLSHLIFNPFEDYMKKNEYLLNQKNTIQQQSKRKGILKSSKGNNNHNNNNHDTDETKTIGDDKKTVAFDEISQHSATPYIQMTDMQPKIQNNLIKGYLNLFVDAPASSAPSYFPIHLIKSGPSWKKYYFVLKRSYLFYYPDEKSYETDPAKTINARPIDLEGYKIVLGQINSTFEFSLIPIDSTDIRKPWKFQCESLKVYKYWVENIQQVINSFNK